MLLSCLMLFTAGCSTSKPDSTTAANDQSTDTVDTKPAEEKAESIRVITYFAGSDTWAPTWKEVIAEYMADHPNITIIDESVPTAGTSDVIRPKMNADISAGTPADCALYFNSTDAESLYKSGL